VGDGLVERAGGDGIDAHGETARRRERRRRRPGVAQALCAQAGDEAFGEGGAEPLQCLRRQLLDEELDEQRSRFAL
jgi:hypothetical protein